MHIEAVNVGAAQDLTSGRTRYTSGIFKTPVVGPVEVRESGLEGDVQVDRKHHGGVDQAVYVYSRQDYDWWQTRLDRELPAGTFGENLTLDRFPVSGVRIGDTLEIRTVKLQVTAPRVPCGTLAARMEEPMFVKWFVQAERPGFYARVLQTGQIERGLQVCWSEEGVVGLIESYRLYSQKESDREIVEKLLAAPVGHRFRDFLESL